MRKTTGALVATALLFSGLTAVGPAAPALAAPITLASEAPIPAALDDVTPDDATDPATVEPEVTPVEGAEDDDPTEITTPEPITATSLPRIRDGLATVGMPAAAEQGTWDRDDLSFSYQWQLDGADIAGATEELYTPLPEQANGMLAVVITASAEGVSPVAAASEPVRVRPGALTLGSVTLSGTTAVGQTLTARVQDSVPAGATLSYQWSRGGAPIAGATAASYRLTAQDLGKTVRVTVTGDLWGYERASQTSAASKTVTVGALSAATPKIAGTVAVGKTLTATPGTWGPGTVRLSYQWLRNGATIAKATGASYKLTAADAGKKISVRVTGAQTGFTAKSATSAATGAVLRTLTAAPTPSVSGTARVGKALTAKAGTWKPEKVTLSYQWLRNGTAIRGATKSSYTLTAGDAGTKVTVRVTGKKAGYLSVSKTSGATNVPRVLQAPKPTISGGKLVGTKLSVNRGTWTSGTTLATQWLRNGAAIRGATGTSYTLTAADAGKTISVRVTGSKSGYAGETRTSAATQRIGYPQRTAPTGGWNCPAWAPIKGNANSGIYHLPGGAYYSRTKPEDCFATAAAAQRAGYRPSKR